MTTQPAQARVFRECGSALIALGRGLRLGAQLIALGSELRKVSAAKLTEDNLLTLRGPVDDFRALVDGLATMLDELRKIVDVLSATIGYDGN